MSAPNWIGIAGVIVAAGTFISVVIGAIAQYKAVTRVDKRIDQQSDKVDQVHTIVNQQRTDMVEIIAYQKKLIEQLEQEKEDDASRS